MHQTDLIPSCRHTSTYTRTVIHVFVSLAILVFASSLVANPVACERGTNDITRLQVEANSILRTSGEQTVEAEVGTRLTAIEARTNFMRTTANDRLSNPGLSLNEIDYWQNVLAYSETADEYVTTLRDAFQVGFNSAVLDPFLTYWESEVEGFINYPNQSFTERYKRAYGTMLSVLSETPPEQLGAYRTWERTSPGVSRGRSFARNAIRTYAESETTIRAPGSQDLAASAGAVVYKGGNSVPYFTDIYTNPEDGAHRVSALKVPRNPGTLKADVAPWAEILPNQMGAVRVTNADGFITWLKQNFYAVGLPANRQMHPTLEGWIRDYVAAPDTQWAQTMRKGLPGTHAEIFATNEALWNGNDPANTSVATIQLAPGRTGDGFFACPNCSGILRNSGVYILPGGGTLQAPVGN